MGYRNMKNTKGRNWDGDLVLIHTQGLNEGIRCAMCTNGMKSDRGCDGSCAVDNAMYTKVMEVIEGNIAEMPSITPQESDGATKTLDAIRAEIKGLTRFGLRGEIPSFVNVDKVLQIIDYYRTQEPESTSDDWIPVAEQLPKEYQKVIYSTEYASYSGFYHDDGFYDERDEIRSLVPVYAWKPMPKPYKKK